MTLPIPRPFALGFVPSQLALPCFALKIKSRGQFPHGWSGSPRSPPPPTPSTRPPIPGLAERRPRAKAPPRPAKAEKGRRRLPHPAAARPVAGTPASPPPRCCWEGSPAAGDSQASPGKGKQTKTYSSSFPTPHPLK